MRDILFRGKRMDNGEWVEGSFLQDGEAHRPLRCEGLPFSDCYIVPKTDRDNVRRYLTQGILLDIRAHHVFPATIGQFTGLLDKNGKRIFEGDVFEWGYAGVKEFRYVVVYDATLTSFVGERHFGFVTLNGVDIEIIGNIHDNPELMGGGADD